MQFEKWSFEFRGKTEPGNLIRAFCGTGFSLWGLGLAWTKPHRLKPMPLKARQKFKRVQH